jgi:hypothetical protein
VTGSQRAPRFTRISDIRSGTPADTTLQNLVGLLHQKLEMSARLPILAYEADGEGHKACAELFRSFAVVEHEQIVVLLDALRGCLDPALEKARPPQPPQ